MGFPAIVGFSGNLTRPSRTRAFVEHVAREVARSTSRSSAVYDIEDLGPSLAAARWGHDLDDQARRIVARITDAELLIIDSPTFKGSYTGLFKHFFDLLDPATLRGKPVIITATGGGERHALIVEHQLRPLLGFFEAFALPTAIYASDKDFSEGVLTNPAILARSAQAVAEAQRILDVTRPKQADPPPLIRVV